MLQFRESTENSVAITEWNTPEPHAVAVPSRPIRILFLTLRADFGGGPEHVWQLLQNLPEDASPFVACPEDYPYYERYCRRAGADNIYRLPYRAFSFLRLWGLRRFCREKDITLLHSHGKGAGLYSRLLAAMTGLPCVHTFHGVHTGEYSPLVTRIYCFYEWLMAVVTRAGIAVSKGEADIILRRKLMPEKKLVVVPNGVVIPDAPVEGQCAEPYTVVSISRFDYAKNSGFLLDILQALQDRGRLGDFRLIVIGDGLERQMLVDRAKKMGFSDFFRCTGSTNTPFEFFQGALCYLSTSRWEGLPLGVLEAMAHGLPVVATDVVGNRDAVFEGKTGFLYQESDADAAADALIALAEDADRRNAFGQAARSFVMEKHSARTMVEQTAHVWRNAVRKGN